MFVREKTTPNSPRKSVQIVESVRIDGKVKQRIVRHIGIAEDEAHLMKLRNLALFTMNEIKKSSQPNLRPAETEIAQIVETRNKKNTTGSIHVDLAQLREVSRVTIGIHEVYGQLYDNLGFNRLMGARRKASDKILRDLVMARLANPLSKLASTNMLQRDFGVEIDVNQVYRMMDHLDDKMQDKIQKIATQSAEKILDRQIDVMFFDCTTLYFESFDEGELRQKGFSKDHKTAETQVLLALLVTREGLPISYKLYPGAKWEGHTLMDAVKDLQQNYPIKHVVLVADSGLFNKENLALMDANNQSYIVAARLKNLPRSVQNELFTGTYESLNEGITYLETTYLNKRLIVTHSVKRAKKDAHERQKVIEKLEKGYHKKSMKSAIAGHKAKYMKIEGDGQLVLDEERIAASARWDGLHGIITNVPDLSVQEALAHYHGLWQVEETFRLSKHDLRIRPIFHWSDRRIKAHVALCFIALTCVRWLTYYCSMQYQKLSAEVIRNELMHVQVSLLEDQQTKKVYGIPSKSTKCAQGLYKLVGKQLKDCPFEVM